MGRHQKEKSLQIFLVTKKTLYLHHLQKLVLKKNLKKRKRNLLRMIYLLNFQIQNHLAVALWICLVMVETMTFLDLQKKVKQQQEEQKISTTFLDLLKERIYSVSKRYFTPLINLHSCLVL